MESKSDIHQKNITYLYWKSKEIPQKYQIIYFEHTKSFVSLIQNYVIFILKHVVTGKINNETTKFSGEIGEILPDFSNYVSRGIFLFNEVYRKEFNLAAKKLVRLLKEENMM